MVAAGEPCAGKSKIQRNRFNDTGIAIEPHDRKLRISNMDELLLQTRAHELDELLQRYAATDAEAASLYSALRTHLDSQKYRFSSFGAKKMTAIGYEFLRQSLQLGAYPPTRPAHVRPLRRVAVSGNLLAVPRHVAPIGTDPLSRGGAKSRAKPC